MGRVVGAGVRDHGELDGLADADHAAYALAAALQTYTPVWSATGTQPAIGNGTLTGRWYQSGRLLYLKITMTIGSTTTFGTGNYRWTYPPGVVGAATIGSRWLLDAFAFDSVPGTYYRGQALTGFVDSTKLAIVRADGTNGEWSSTVPFTWASGDHLTMTGVMELD